MKDVLHEIAVRMTTLDGLAVGRDFDYLCEMINLHFDNFIPGMSIHAKHYPGSMDYVNGQYITFKEDPKVELIKFDIYRPDDGDIPITESRWEDLRILLFTTLLHEFRHVVQWRPRTCNNMFSKSFEKDKTDIIDYSYFSNPDEIDAFAFEQAWLLLAACYGNIEKAKRILSCHWEYETFSMHTFKQYHDNFRRDSKTWKRFGSAVYKWLHFFKENPLTLPE
tara:strand:- start:6678 stop:7343 length:666 start_codon:yes stop_codon:yes gene_type:complete